jgi:hypothetical protein
MSSLTAAQWCGKSTELGINHLSSPFILSFLHLLTCIYIVPPPLLTPQAPQPLLPGRICSALFFDFVEEKT